MKILILGGDGMLGHVVKHFLKEKGYEVSSTNREKGKEDFVFDIKDTCTPIQEIIKTYKPKVIINCIGILNEATEKNKALSILVNSYLPHYLENISKDMDFKLVHISTDCVFNGKEGKYTEESQPNAEDFYGQTKALGEVMDNHNITLRTSIVGPDNNPKGIGLFQWFMSQKGKINGYEKVIWTGVTTIQLAKCIETAIEKDLTGLHHCVNNEFISKYELLNLFKEVFNKDIEIEKVQEPVSEKTLIRTEKSYRFNIPSYSKMIKEMKDWIEEHRKLYPNLIKEYSE
jgi:dTDP-4-dehydrorhamnose reductase